VTSCSGFPLFMFSAYNKPLSYRESGFFFSPCPKRFKRNPIPAILSAILVKLSKRRTGIKGTSGIKPIGKEGRNLNGMDFFLLWAGAAVSLAEIWAGRLMVPLGFLSGFVVLIIGHIIGNTPLTLDGIIGSRTGIMLWIGGQAAQAVWRFPLTAGVHYYTCNI